MDNNVKFVYCDIGGVLFNEAGTDSLINEFNIDWEQFRKAEKKYHKKCFTGKISANDLIAFISKDIGIEIPVEDYNDYWTSHAKPYPAGQEMLSKIIDKYPVGILTNDMKGSLKYYRKYGHLPDFDYATIIESTEEGVKKPDEEIYRIAEKKSGYSGNEIFYIDDRKSNLEAAEKFSWQVAHYNRDDQEGSVSEILKRLNIPQ